MKIELQPRLVRPLWLSILLPVLAIGLTMLFSAMLFMILGKEPWGTVKVLFIDPFFDPYNLPEVFVKATPLILIAVGLAVGFRANIWNIGAEGQFILGTIGATSVAMAFYPGGGFLLLPMMMLAGMLFGAVYALIVAFLKVRFNTSEILVSLMLVYVAEQILEVLIRGPLQDPKGLNFPKSRSFQDDALLPILFDGTRVHIGVLFTFLLAVALAVFLARHRFGFDIVVAGQAPRAARYSGVDDKRIVYLTLLIGGALAGLAGAFEVAGPAGSLDAGVASGYGFTAIIVAFLGRLNPLGIVLAGLIIAATTVGGQHFSFGLPPDMVNWIQGMMLFILLAVELFDRYRIKIGD